MSAKVKPNDVDYYRIHLNKLLRKAQRNNISIKEQDGVVSFTNLSKDDEFDFDIDYVLASVNVHNYVNN